jgi:hypothetical protein
VIPTPAQIGPLVEPLAGPIHEALRLGIDFADHAMLDHDASFHSHCARYRAKRAIGAMEHERWKLVTGVGNSGIHFSIDGLHTARLLHSLQGKPPHPGTGATRQSAWRNPDRPVQLQLGLGYQIDETLQCGPLSLLFDWHLFADEPLVHVSLPKSAWRYGQLPKLHWRVRLNDPGSWLADVKFSPVGIDSDLHIEFDLDDEQEARG